MSCSQFLLALTRSSRSPSVCVCVRLFVCIAVFTAVSQLSLSCLSAVSQLSLSRLSFKLSFKLSHKLLLTRSFSSSLWSSYLNRYNTKQHLLSRVFISSFCFENIYWGWVDTSSSLSDVHLSLGHFLFFAIFSNDQSSSWRAQAWPWEAIQKI